MPQPDAIPLLLDGPATGPASGPAIVLAHGAGAAMDSDFMTAMAQGLAAAGLRVARFEFPYMARRRAEGSQRPPDRQPVLLDTWRQVIGQLGGAARLVIGGKSMGGRMASLLADELGARGLVCLGYPFHPAGKPERTRTDHLAALATPTLMVQGERDALGNRTEVVGYALSPAIRLHWIADGDHSLVPRKSSGRTRNDNWNEAIAAITGFVERL